jgi:putative ABC transport system permease protein
VMKSFLIIAWRNVLRNKRRSWITVFSIGFGLGAMLFIWGFIDGAHLQLKENFTGLFMGHLQIHAQGFEKSMAINKVIKDPVPVETRLRGHREVEAYTQRVRTFAFFRTSQNSMGGLLVGIDPLQDPKVSKIGQSIYAGRFLKPGDRGEIVLGNLLAENLKVALKGECLVLAQAVDGSVKTASFRVIGIIKTGIEEMDRGMALVSIQDSQNLLGLDKGVTDIVIRVHSLNRLNDLAQSLKKEWAHRGLEIMTWSEISPVLQQWIDFDEAFAYVFLLIVLVVVVAGILNTILMSLLERTREFGIMMALGTKGYQLALMVGMESFLLGMMGLTLGIILGLSSVGIFARVGIPISAKVKEAMASFFISDVIYPTVVWDHILSNSLVVLFSCILISLYPAWKVSKVRPVKALHSV